MIYLDSPDRETRATNRFVAAVEAFWGWMLFGPPQHDADLRWSLGSMPRYTAGETLRERSAGK